MKILFDTNILINRIGNNSDNVFFNRATFIIKKCDELNWIKCISERTLREFEKGWTKYKFPKEKLKKEKAIINEFHILPYYFGNETIDQIDGSLNNIGSVWNNEKEINISNEILAELLSVNAKTDRGILLDAIMNKCSMVVSENYKEFDKLKTIAERYNVIVCIAKNFKDIYLEYT